MVPPVSPDVAPKTPPTVVIVGPTAVGKSRLAMELAPIFEAEIVSADSRQVYRYMDIGTAKPTEEDRTAIRHYMLDLVQPDQTFSAELYRQEATKVLRRIAMSGKVALVVGGTGFYLDALLGRTSPAAIPPNPTFRGQLREEADDSGPEALHRRLSRLDPVAAARIHPNNLPRVIRALEIVDALGGPVPPPDPARIIPALLLGLTTDRDRLGEIADRRVLQQVELGLVGETEALLGMGYPSDAPALLGFGYRQMVDYLQGRLSEEEAVSRYQQATRQYIRRQMTWFRRERDIQWLEVGTNTAKRARELVDAWLEESGQMRIRLP